jgi:hypothetical protein
MKRAFLAFTLACGVAAAQSYCAASTTTGVCGTDEYISNVTFGSVNNTTACATGYTNFVGSIPAESVSPGGSFVVSVSIGSFFTTDKVTVWCDWNQNFMFDSGEETNLSAPTATTPATGTINVPATAAAGLTVMRVAMAWNTANPQPACGTIGYGEREDYELNVVPAVPPFTLGFTSPLGNGSLQIDMANGAAGGLYFMGVSFVTGAFPNGPFYGIELSLFEVISQYNAGPPFIGFLDGTGAFSIGPFAGLPSGLTFYAVALDNILSAAAVASAPVAYQIP